MARACHGPVRAAVGDAFSDEEIDDIVARLEGRFRERMRAEPGTDAKATMRAAAADMTKEQVAAELQARRAEAAGAAARDRRRAQIDGTGLKGADALAAFMSGTERQVRGGSLSADALARVRQAELWGEVSRGLQSERLMDRVASWWGGNNPDFELRVAQEMSRRNGGAEAPTHDRDAEKVAEIFGAALEHGRRMQNDEGAWIGRLDGYIVRQSHDSLKVAGGFWRELGELRRSGLASWADLKARSSQRAYQVWRDATVPLLHERTFEGVDALAAGGALDGAGLPFASAADARERFLQKVWWDIVTGRHTILEGMSDTGDFRPPPSKARSVSASRVLHYKDAASWMAYNRRFGSGNLGAAVIGDLGRAGKNAALMRAFGPAPEAAFAAERERLIGAARDRNDAVGGKALASSRLQGAFEQLNGAAGAPDSLRVAAVARAFRANESLSKLGAMLISGFADAPVSAQTLARAGVSWLDGYKGALGGVTRLAGAERREVAELLDIGARSTVGHIASPFHSNDGVRGLQSWAMNLFYKVNGFEFWNDGLRGGVASMLAAHMGREADSGWANLHPGTRETLERFGLDGHAWELLRQGAREIEPGSGRRYLLPDAAEGIDDDAANRWAGHTGDAAGEDTAARARDELKLRLSALFHETTDTAVSEPRAREHMATNIKVNGHPILTEALRTFMQFKGFPLTYVTRQLLPAARGYAGRKPVALLAHLILGTTLFGYLSMQAKQLAKGREMRPLFDENGKADMRPWIAALSQGGGLGIYGDFLFGEYNRAGGSLAGTLGGPGVGDAEQMAKMFGMLRDGEDPRTGKFQGGDPRTAAYQFATSNTPFLNLWYTRAALDYTLLWRVQEAMNPGWAARYEENVHKNTGSRYWLKPTQAVQ